MTVSRPCYFGNLLLGVVGVDVNLAYILEDVTYYQDSLASYTFLIDNKGQSHSGRRGGANILIGLLTFTRSNGHHIRISRTNLPQCRTRCLFQLMVRYVNSVCRCTTKKKGFKS